MQASSQRAVWGMAEEKVLLELFEKARQDQELRTDRGVKPKGWKNIAEEINRRCSSTFNVDQLKSKCSRLMMDYELFKDVGGERSLSDQDWDRVIRELPEQAPRLHKFKDSKGFVHAEICRHISLGKEELTMVAQATTKRPPDRADDELPEAKRACIEIDHGAMNWSDDEEKLLLFLYWRTKHNSERFSYDEGILPDTWLEVTNDLHKHGKRTVDKKQVKAKYVQLMLSYDRFKRTTGFSGALEAAPKCEKDWDQLIQEHPTCSLELQRLKNQGGFPHVEVCSLISGDTAGNGVEPANMKDFLATGTLHHQSRATDLENKSQLIPQATVAAHNSPCLPVMINKSVQLPTTNDPEPATTAGETETTTGVPAAAAAPAVLTQELHDNLNMFLKTATAYVVMLISEHNQGNEN